MSLFFKNLGIMVVVMFPIIGYGQDLQTPDLISGAQNKRNIFSLAEQGEPEAQYRVSLKYLYGIGVPRNREKAKDWCEKSAEQGFAPAQYKLAFLANKSIKIEKEWLLKAAEQGFLPAQYKLGDYYERDKKNGEMARFWYNKACENGLRDGCYRYGLLSDGVYPLLNSKGKPLAVGDDFAGGVVIDVTLVPFGGNRYSGFVVVALKDKLMGKKYSLDEALEALEAYVLDGYLGWRFPDEEEYRLIIDTLPISAGDQYWTVDRDLSYRKSSFFFKKSGATAEYIENHSYDRDGECYVWVVKTIYHRLYFQDDKK